jgi:hypothetical protein
MYILISIFYISLMGIIAMILLKKAEMKNGDDYFTNKIESTVELALSKAYSKIIYAFRLVNRRTFIALAQYITYHLLFRIRKIYVEIKYRTLQNPHGKRMIDAIRGRGEVKNHGASFYLRRISGR